MKFLVPEELETEKLILRQFRDNDWVALHKYYSDPVATKFSTGRCLTEGETWRAMASMIGHWTLRGYGPYAVVEKKSETVLGPIGFWYPNDWPFPEIKWALAPDFWGKGFAKEATLAVQATGRKYMPDLSLISFIHSENESSIKLAQSVGATFERETEFRGGVWHIYCHPTATQKGNTAK